MTAPGIEDTEGHRTCSAELDLLYYMSMLKTNVRTLQGMVSVSCYQLRSELCHLRWLLENPYH